MFGHSGRIYFRGDALVWFLKFLMKILLNYKLGGSFSLSKVLHFGTWRVIHRRIQNLVEHLRFQPLTIFLKSFILDVRLDSEYTPVMN